MTTNKATLNDTATNDQAALDALLADLSADMGDDLGVEKEVIEEALPEEPKALAADDALLDEIFEEVKFAEATQDLYADQSGATVASESIEDVPATTAEDLLSDKPAAAPKAEKKTKEGEETKPDVEAAETEAGPKAPKEPRATRVTHKPGDLLLVKLGEKADDFLTFDVNDVEDPEKMAAKRDVFIAKMNDKDAIAVKVKEKIVQLFAWLTKGGELNEVMKRTFVLLHKDGELTSGDKGNLHASLLSKPYSQGTARSQGCQMFLVLPELELTKREKGKMIANPDSALLPVINQMLGLV